MSDERLHSLLEFIYGADQAAEVYLRLRTLIEAFDQRYTSLTHSRRFITERDVVLITYGDSIQQPNEAPLLTLDIFLKAHVDVINTVHILPFYPYSSDDGFSVIDYREVNPALGEWKHIKGLGEGFKLMFDAVVNHMSAQSVWFKAFLNDEEAYRDFYVTADPQTDLSQVTRPRLHPLLTAFETPHGVNHVWTTFSADQVDLNFANPNVLLEIIDVLLLYIERSAEVIRLDAIAFLWKEIGTTCIHLPKTHAVVQLLRAIVDQVAPHVLLITETNVPHAENLSYFGDGTNEAHLVYQFALPPLIAHTLISGSAQRLREWVSTLTVPTEQTAFFNFTASHDGIGVRPVTGILSEEELDVLLERTIQNGGRVSYKTNPDGSQSPYELNIVYYSLLNALDTDEPQAVQVQRFMCSQAIMLALAGMPAIYIHSLLGSQNDLRGLAALGYNRAINREKFSFNALEREFADASSVRHQVFNGYRHLLLARTYERAFHPSAAQRVLDLPDAVFGVLRAGEGGSAILALHNISAQSQAVTYQLRRLGYERITTVYDIVGDQFIEVINDTLNMELQPYKIAWLRLNLS